MLNLPYSLAVMRVLFTSREEISPYVGDIIDHLNKILIVISKNPSNPQFNHYTFEAIGALVRLDIHRLFVRLSVLPYLSLIFAFPPAIRFCCVNSQEILSHIEGVLFPSFQTILQQDVTGMRRFS